MLPALILSVSAFLAGEATAACTREGLSQVASKFLNNIKNGSPLGLASSVIYTENFKDANIASGVFSKAIKIAHNRTLLDAPGCAIYVEIIAPDNKPGYHLGTQLFVDGAGKVNKVEAIINSDVSGSNSWYYNGTRTLQVILQEEAEGGRGVIPEAKRDSRAMLKQVAEDFFDIVGVPREARGSSASAKKMPKLAPGCTRQEGGFPKQIPCSLGAPPGNSSSTPKPSSPPASKSAVKRLGDRGRMPAVRGMVIDETVGTVEAFGFFAGNAPDTHDFRVENGLVRYVHTITVMNTNSAPGPPKGNQPKGATTPKSG